MDVYARLISMDEKSAEKILTDAFNEYMETMYLIAEDIYDSCIQLYYDSYAPKIYDRHGDAKGFNLYSAEDILWNKNSSFLDINFDPSKLIEYDVPKTSRGEYKEKREVVLKTVMRGLRGAGSYKNMKSNWPQPWYAYYPNIYSKYDIWTSFKSTIDDIYIDFCGNALRSTSYLFEEYIQKRL